MEEVLTLNNKKKVSPFYKRIHEIDLLRGFLILLVTMDHLLWGFQRYGYTWMNLYPDNQIFAALYRGASYYWLNPYRDIVRYIVLFGFTFTAGVSIAFSKNAWRRCGLLMILWLVLAVGSNLLSGLPILKDTNAASIDFNILGVLAFSTLFYCLIAMRSDKGIIAAIAISFFIWWIFIPYLQSAFPGIEKAYIPIFWDPASSGRPQSDWLPLFPYIMFFFCGVIFSRHYYVDKTSHFTRHEIEKPLCFMGRHSLFIYLGWEVIVILVFTVVGEIIKACYAH